MVINMEGIKNTLVIIEENWTNILIFISCLFAIYRKAKKYINMNKEEKEKKKEELKEETLKIVKTVLLKLMSEAEIEWNDFEKSGSIKRSQVIKELYNEFPILKEFTDQDKLLEIIDNMINEEKSKMDEVINNITN